VVAYEHLLPDQVRILGDDRPDVLITRGNLAQWRSHAGNRADAVTDMHDLLNDKLRVFGPDHPHTLAARRMLACWRGEATPSVLFPRCPRLHQHHESRWRRTR
jgi:hypothetical protein